MEGKLIESVEIRGTNEDKFHTILFGDTTNYMVADSSLEAFDYRFLWPAATVLKKIPKKMRLASLS